MGQYDEAQYCEISTRQRKNKQEPTGCGDAEVYIQGNLCQHLSKSEVLISRGGGAPPQKKKGNRIKISGTALMENHPWLAGALWALLKTIAVY